jgi:hypothetical protein
VREVPHRLDYYRQQRDLALEQAEGGDVDREGWLRIADEWQKLLDTLAVELNQSQPDTHVLDL